MKYTIDRAKLVFGGGRYGKILGPTQLLNQNGYMCCLGQICMQDGVDAGALARKGTPKFVSERHLPDDHWLLEKNKEGYTTDSDIAVQMIETNDNKFCSLEEREELLILLAASVGHELEFVGEYPAGVI